MSWLSKNVYFKWCKFIYLFKFMQLNPFHILTYAFLYRLLNHLLIWIFLLTSSYISFSLHFSWLLVWSLAARIGITIWLGNNLNCLFIVVCIKHIIWWWPCVANTNTVNTMHIWKNLGKRGDIIDEVSKLKWKTRKKRLETSERERATAKNKNENCSDHTHSKWRERKEECAEYRQLTA